MGLVRRVALLVLLHYSEADFWVRYGAPREGRFFRINMVHFDLERVSAVLVLYPVVASDTAVRFLFSLSGATIKLGGHGGERRFAVAVQGRRRAGNITGVHTMCQTVLYIYIYFFFQTYHL